MYFLNCFFTCHCYRVDVAIGALHKTYNHELCHKGDHIRRTVVHHHELVVQQELEARFWGGLRVAEDSGLEEDSGEEDSGAVDSGAVDSGVAHSGMAEDFGVADDF